MWGAARRSVAAVALVALAFAVGCGGGDDQSASKQSGDSGKPIKIGASLPLTGEFSEPGKAAQQGYKVWEEMTNEKGGLLGRKVEIVIKDDGQQPEHDRRRLQRADRQGQGRPAARDVLLAAEPAGLGGRRAQPHALRRAGRRLARDLQPRLQVPVLRPAGDGQPPGRRVRQLRRRAAARPEAQDRGVPDARRPVRGPDVEGIEAILKKARRQDGLPQDLHDRQRELRLDRQRDQGHQRRPGRPRRDVRGRGRLDPGAAEVGYTPKMLFQTSGAVAAATSTRRRSASENTEGVFYAVSHSVEAKTPGNPEFVAKYKEMFGGTEVPEDAADAFAAAAGDGGGGQGGGQHRRPAQARRLAALERGRHDPRAAELERGRRPKGQFLVGQWQSGKPEIVLPQDAATADAPLPGWKPGG